MIVTIKIEVRGITNEYADEASAEIAIQFDDEVNVEAIAELAARRAFDDAIAVGGKGIER